MLKFNNFPPTKPEDVSFTEETQSWIQDQAHKTQDEDVLVRMSQFGLYMGGVIAANTESRETAMRITEEALITKIPEGVMRDVFLGGADVGIALEGIDAQERMNEGAEL